MKVVSRVGVWARAEASPGPHAHPADDLHFDKKFGRKKFITYDKLH
jgi:hypothetical protein